jgi:hypothetical protein
MGIQYANKGLGYIGIATFLKYYPNLYREYIEVPLNQQLKQNKSYCVSWYINLSEKACLASNKIGAYFSNDTIFQSNQYEYINLQPQVFDNRIILDSNNWIHFKQKFKSNGSEKFMTIGNFSEANKINFIEDVENGCGVSYYYFDDFGVYELPEISAGLGGEIDTLGENVLLQANCEGCWNDLVYRWWPSAGLSDTTILNPIATPEVTTTYYFGLIDTSETVPCIVDLVDSVTVFVTIPQDTVTPPPTSFSWLVYPSPTNGNLTLQFSALEFDSQLLIIDARGRLVRKIAVPKNTESLPLDISALAAGEYFLQVENEGLKEKRKIVKF